jgi:hypothetical protein
MKNYSIQIGERLSSPVGADAASKPRRRWHKYVICAAAAAAGVALGSGQAFADGEAPGVPTPEVPVMPGLSSSQTAIETGNDTSVSLASSSVAPVGMSAALDSEFLAVLPVQLPELSLELPMMPDMPMIPEFASSIDASVIPPAAPLTPYNGMTSVGTSAPIPAAPATVASVPELSTPADPAIVVSDADLASETGADSSVSVTSSSSSTDGQAEEQTAEVVPVAPAPVAAPVAAPTFMVEPTTVASVVPAAQAALPATQPATAEPFVPVAPETPDLQYSIMVTNSDQVSISGPGSVSVNSSSSTTNGQTSQSPMKPVVSVSAAPAAPADVSTVQVRPATRPTPSVSPTSPIARPYGSDAQPTAEIPAADQVVDSDVDTGANTSASAGGSTSSGRPLGKGTKA